ncbi:phage tail tape measure protein [Actinobaculum suis]|uniref:Phage tail tape measure protein n=1 Tax=Actinobaculum suis TaxID=1657 RepID=A0A7Z8YAB8_9ACTO|nr:hypothetical protein [Actinobaculum suis]VDG76909.1 phage tail tape measure protein [Actinobaculum suis]
MAKSKAIKIAVLADTRQFRRAMQNVGDVSGFNALKKGLGKVGEKLKAVAKIGAVAATAIGGAAIKAASDLEQSAGTIDDVFKQYASTVHATARQASKSLGLSENSYNELATVIATQLKNGGTALDQLAGKSNELISLGADLSAGFGGSTVDAVNAISSALKGERDPIERYGVSLNQAAVDAKAAELGFTKVGGSLSNEANQAATLALIMEQTTDFHGKFASESDTLAHKVQVLKAQFENGAATIGSFLIPAVSAAAGWLSDNLGPAIERISAWMKSNFVPALQTIKQKFAEWKPAIQDTAQKIGAMLLATLRSLGSFITGTLVPALTSVVDWIGRNKTLIITLGSAILGALAAWKAYQTAMAVWKAAVAGWTALQAAFNAVMSANPVMLVVVAIGALVAGFIALWNNCEGFRNFWIGLWEGIKGTVNAVVTWFTETVPAFFSSAIASIKAYFQGLRDRLSAIWENIKAGVVGAVTGIVSWFQSLPGRIGQHMESLKRQIKEGIDRAVQFFRDMPGSILRALGNLGSLLLDAGKKIIGGFIDGIKSKFNAVKETLGNLTDKLFGWKGPPKRDAVILKRSGQLVIDGFITGLESRYGAVRNTLGQLTTNLPGMMPKPSYVPPSGGPLYGYAPSGAPIIINVTSNMLQPSPQAGRMIAESIGEYVRTSGRKVALS